MCGDYRRLNTAIVLDKYSISNLHDFASNLEDRTIFFALDLEKAFLQKPIYPEDVPKTAVTTPFGLYEFLVMIFGFRNAAQTFQRYINQAVGDLHFVFAFVDDILVASSSDEEDQEHLKVVLRDWRSSISN